MREMIYGYLTSYFYCSFIYALIFILQIYLYKGSLCPTNHLKFLSSHFLPRPWDQVHFFRLSSDRYKILTLVPNTTHVKVYTIPFKCTISSCSSPGFRYQKDLKRRIDSVHRNEVPGIRRFYCPIEMFKHSEANAQTIVCYWRKRLQVESGEVDKACAAL